MLTGISQGYNKKYFIYTQETSKNAAKNHQLQFLYLQIQKQNNHFAERE